MPILNDVLSIIMQLISHYSNPMCVKNDIKTAISNKDKINHYKLILVGGGGSGTLYYNKGKQLLLQDILQESI